MPLTGLSNLNGLNGGGFGNGGGALNPAGEEKKRTYIVGQRKII